jgi:hypothetical protein
MSACPSWNLCWLLGTPVLKSNLRAIYWSHPVCRREVAQLELESMYGFHTLIPFSVHKENSVFPVLIPLRQRLALCFHALDDGLGRWMKPRSTSLVLGTLADLTRDKAELVAENALLRHQLIILQRQVKRPVSRKTDRLLLVLLARMVRTWKQALFLVQPETLLRWHRELFRLFWKRKSKPHSRKPRLSPETIRFKK